MRIRDRSGCPPEEIVDFRGTGVEQLFGKALIGHALGDFGYKTSFLSDQAS